MSKGNSKLFSNTAGTKEPQYIKYVTSMDDLDLEKTTTTFKTFDGQYVILVKDDKKKGINHIKSRHKEQLEKCFDIEEENIESFIIDVIKNNPLIYQNKNKDLFFYKVNESYSLATVISSISSYIITAYPINSIKILKEKEKNNGR